MTPSWLVVMGDGLDHRLDGPYFLDHQYHRRSTGITSWNCCWLAVSYCRAASDKYHVETSKSALM